MSRTRASLSALLFPFFMALAVPRLSVGSDHDGKDSQESQPPPALESSEPRKTSPETLKEREPLETAEVPIFKPPNRPHPTRRVGGATRGSSPSAVSGIEALVPNQIGLTLKERPVLYWYAPQVVKGRAELVVTRENQIEPAVAASIDGPFQPGVQRIRLADHGLALEPDVVYEWAVTVFFDSNTADPETIGGAIERVQPTGELHSKIALGGPIHVLAAEGIWYDAIDELSEKIDDAPTDTTLRRQRAALFKQVGLEDAAAADLAAAGLTP